MNNCAQKLFAMALLAANVLVMASARAQLQSGPGTVLGSGADGIDDLVDQDVAKGYYTAEQGEQLKAQSDQLMENLTESLVKAGAAVQRTESLASSGGQMTQYQLGSLANGQGQLKLGGTPEEIEEQARAIYNASHQTLEVGQAQIENIAPVLQTFINEISKVLNLRNALIQNNPNVSPAVKHNVRREAEQVEDATKNALQSGIGKFTEKMQQAQATMDNNKEQIINQIKDAIATKSAAEGTDPSKWTKPSKPTPKPPQTALPPKGIEVAPKDPDAQAPTPNLPGTPQVYVPTPNGSEKGSTTTSKGTVPSNEPDPALSATRNSNSGKGTPTPGTGTPSNNGGNTRVSNTGAGKPAASTASNTSNSSNSSNSPAKATNPTPVKISQVLTNPSAPKPQTPPAPPKLNQQDIKKALNQKTNIPNLPVAQPPSNALPNAPVDPKAIGLNNKPSNNPPGNGKAVNQNAPPSNSGKPVLMPSSNQDLGMPPQTDQTSQEADQPQGTATQTAHDAPTGTGSNTASEPGTASDAAGNATNTAADASNSPEGASQNGPAKTTNIPVSLNDPNAEAAQDQAFNANRLNPNPEPVKGAPVSGEVVVGPTNTDPNPGSFIPPDQQSAPQDASDVAKANANTAAASGATPPPSNQPSMTDIEDQIAKQFKPGNVGGHLVEGDDEMEGVSDATPGVQMPALSSLDTSVEFGDTLSVATLASIYVDYTVTPGQNGSSVIVAGTTQVAMPSSLMTAPSHQVSTPGALMTAPSSQVQSPSSVMIAPSNQVQFPSSVMTDPGSQLLFPSALMVIPSSQINFPSSVLSNLVQPAALCGH
jgi:hypothetical protein